jgi:hypothetical protein
LTKVHLCPEGKRDENPSGSGLRGKTVQNASVGIIANPASGSDIRRLVALGTTFGTQEKINMVQRMMVGLAVMGIDHLYLMPDAFHIGESALNRLPQDLKNFQKRVEIFEMDVENSVDDSIYAAQRMHEAGVGCIIVLGGDGTSRAVSKGCNKVPILPVSTGTNNIVPYSVEGTVAGIAAGFVAYFPDKLSEVAYRSKWFEICVEGRKTDLALVDVAVVKGQVIGSRAIWEPDNLEQAFMTRAEPRSTGISSLGGFLEPISIDDPWALRMCFGKPKVCCVSAPLAPGLIVKLGVEAVSHIAMDETIIVKGGQRILALDGEREIPLHRAQSAQITLRKNGPWIVDVFRALKVVSANKLLVS